MSRAGQTAQHNATHYNTLKHMTVKHCNTLQHAATHCNTLLPVCLCPEQGPADYIDCSQSRLGSPFCLLPPVYVCARVCSWMCVCVCVYASFSRLLQMTGLFCRRTCQKRLYSAKETYNVKKPTNRSHPIALFLCSCVYACVCTCEWVQARTCMCMCVWMCVCMFVWMCGVNV